MEREYIDLGIFFFRVGRGQALNHLSHAPALKVLKIIFSTTSAS
jgi:hypothetical protein